MPSKHYCASNEQQGEISDGIARNLAGAGLYVACADTKQPAWRTVCNFTAWNKDLPIKPAPRGLSVRPYGRTKKLQSDECARAPPARGSAIQQGLEMSGCPPISAEHASAIDPNGSKMSRERAATFFRGNTARSHLIARPLTGIPRGRRFQRSPLFRRVVITRPQPFKQVTDQAAQSQILRHQILHLPHGRNVETPELAAPAVEGSWSYAGGTADLRNWNAGAGFPKQLEDFALRESGTPHWMLRL
ncbi:hypothetical protein SAMN05444164_6938 [Bradyrhizobium erythrophlei]|uniref:Uncharacterized protein n=1 Tax=Bradyrhizobium erythrophlei TaxID=1437360 RepID=A0A1H5G6G1_9BRAD|nr:hypothetical protein [Bradyrhizobium erythrophlei]SEE11004.1 hypothetical protein SAMN05444164_6938 [Bradyrhizobium erythrophlei]